MKINFQLYNGEQGYAGYLRDLKDLSKYHSNPTAYFVGVLLNYILRFNETSEFYQRIKEIEKKYAFERPYVG